MRLHPLSTFLALGSLGSVASDKTDNNTLLFSWETQRLEHRQTSPSRHAQLFAFDKPGPTFRPGQCKSGPGSTGWPVQDVWDAFDEQLNGALVRTVPIAASCYHNWGVFDAEKCKNISSRWTDPHLHDGDPTSVMWPLWQGRSCLPTSNAKGANCTLGAYPAYAVNATTVAQIQLAVNFARNQGLRLVVKNTGHDYQGRSSGAGALSIWTHNMQDISFVPNFALGDFGGNVLHIGAGVETLAISKMAEQHNASVVAGMCATVGYAGGYFAGGGHSPLSGLFGTAADHVLAINVVTADGRFVTATPRSHADLFWALRGGGGSTFGVTTSVVTRLLPKVQATTLQMSFKTSANVSAETFWEGTRAYVQNLDRMTQAGLYAYTNLRRDSPMYDNASYSLAAEPLVAPNMSISALENIMKPVFTRLSELGIPYKTQAKHFPSYHAAWEDAWPPSQGHVASPNSVDGGWLFPRQSFSDPASFNGSFQAIKRVVDDGYDITAFGVSPRNPYRVDNSVNPALRASTLFATTSIALPDEPSPDQLRSAQKTLMADILASWRAAAPVEKSGGSYANEGNVKDPDWQRTFYGKQYEKLLQIRRRRDASELFYVPAGVGSEHWEVRTGTQGIHSQNGPLCRTGQVPRV
ncbi:hypothetical protein EsDP_00007215 [Epichloe bromicola]|uniref:FAD-binding PCMH-type domain-containing protein n=1 Tax=Epichloe bromicola TaxID=79588 RepID=A0ABQ0CZX2_9HYPO